MSFIQNSLNEAHSVLTKFVNDEININNINSAISMYGRII